MWPGRMGKGAWMTYGSHLSIHGMNRIALALSGGRCGVQVADILHVIFKFFDIGDNRIEPIAAAMRLQIRLL